MAKSKYFVISCMDPRFQESCDKAIKDLGIKYGEFDRVMVAGGAGNFAVLQDQLKKSVELHGVSEVVLIVHEDCGGGACKEDLTKAEALVKKTYPALKIRKMYLCLNGTAETISCQ